MTNSTTYDLTRIAAIPGSAAALGGAAQRLEGPQRAVHAEPVPTPPPEAEAAGVLQRAWKAVRAKRQRAAAAIDSAEARLDERPTFSMVPSRFEPPLAAFARAAARAKEDHGIKLHPLVKDRRLSSECEKGDRIEVDGTTYEFHPDGGRTTLDGREFRTGNWLPVAKITGKRASVLYLDEIAT